MSARLEARGVKRTLIDADNEVPLVRGVSFSVNAGEFVAILGPSGCGKSSLLYLLGLLDRPTEGEVLLDGAHTSGLSADERTRLRLEKIGFVFQFHFLLPEFTAMENVALPMRRLARLSRVEAEARATLLLDALGLKGEGRKRPSQMSGGQRQRVAIARSLANDPVLILCDEPTGNLDSVNSEMVVRVFQRLAHEEGRAIVCVTHDDNVAAAADRRIRMRDGEIVADER
ncbi:MAG: ABC transporter ATP-binding protein [Hyphomonadaceae bacterium]|nr:ABC transporter ATP-binding protein [Hyphomonadaceae bacterium]